MTDIVSTGTLAPFAPVALRLLTHAVYSEERLYWSLLLRHAETLKAYFACIGLEVVIYEDDGFAYLTQPEQYDSQETMALSLPRITHRSQLTRAITMVAIVLREHLDAWEEQHQAGRCHIPYIDICERCKPFLPETNDERSNAAAIDTALNKLVDWEWLVKRDSPGVALSYEVRPIFKAKFGPESFSALKEVLQHDATGI